MNINQARRDLIEVQENENENRRQPTSNKSDIECIAVIMILSGGTGPVYRTGSVNKTSGK